MTANVNRLYSFRLLGQACLGTLVGALLAMSLASFFFQVGGRPTEMPSDLLPWNLHNIWLKPREKGFYLLTLLLGALGAYFATMRYWIVSYKLIWLFLGISIPGVTLVAGHVLQNNDYFFYLYTILVISLLFVLVASRKSLPISTSHIHLANRSRFQWKSYLLLLVIITFLLIPVSFFEVAARIGMEFHVAGTLIGPALYALNKQLLPGIDYYSQYSIGLPWLFSFFLGNSAEQAILSYVIFAIAVTWLFFANLILLLRWLYQSWIPATIVTLLFLILLFHGERHFFDPSSSVLRYPLLGLSAWGLAQWIAYPNSMIRHFLLSGLIALSIFFNTETGIITTIAVIFAAFTQNKRFISLFPSVLFLGLTTIIVLASLVWLAFGQHAFNLNFLNRILVPLVYFGRYGFGGTPIIWSLNDLNWFYNLVAPGIVLGTLGLLIHSKNNEIDQPRLGVLVFFAITGLLMMAKFINMSLIALWQMNSLGFLIVLMWWCNTLALESKNYYFKIPFLKYPISSYGIIWLGIGFMAFLLMAFSFDSRNPANLGLRSWINYPSLAKSIYKHEKVCKSFDCISGKPATRDIELISTRTKPGEQVAIIDLYDWTYLVAAHRPPVMLFIPSTLIFSKYQLEESLRRLKSTPYLFLPKGENKIFNFSHDNIIEGLSPTFLEEYIYDGEGERLVAWKRKNIEMRKI